MATIISTYISPEQAQKAAQDYIDLGKKENALEILSNFLIARKAKNWSTELEEIMTTMIDIAIEYKKVITLREPLNNFKMVSQHSNIGSLESILNTLATNAELTYTNFDTKVAQKYLEMEDLDNEDVDELFISSLSTDSRSEKAALRESWKCLLDTYRIILEITQKNKKLESLHSKISKRAFEFCKTYKRKIEFKRLSENMRSNLRNMIKSYEYNPEYNKIPYLIDLEDPDTNDEQIALRFEILTYAYHFELWQESIKILGDVNTIMKRRKGIPKAKTLADYFENLSNMFWKSDFYYYHAVAYFNHYQITKSKNKTISSSELAGKSCTFVLSVLSIPPSTNEQTLSEEARADAVSLMSSEINLPSRAELVNYIFRNNILELCTPEIKTLFFLIEDSVDVLSLANKSDPLLAKIKETHPAFSTPLQTIIVYKVLNQLSKLYTKIRIDSFVQFIGKLNFAQCENIINLTTIHDSIKVKIDHRRKLLVFQDEAKELKGLSVKLANFSEEVKDLVYTIEEGKSEANHSQTLTKLIAEAKNYASNAHVDLGKRASIIKDMKTPDKDALAKQRQKDVEQQKSQQEQDKKIQQELAQQRQRAQQQALKDDEERKFREIQEIRKRALFNDLAKNFKGIKIGKKKIEELKDSDIEKLTYEQLEKARSEFEKEEKEKEENFIKKAFRKADFLERAKREEFTKQQTAKWQNGEEKKKEIEAAHKQHHESQLKFKEKIASAAEHRDSYLKEQTEERKKEYDEQLKAFKEKIDRDFRAKIIEKAKESLKAKKDAEEAEERKKQDDFKKQQEKLEANHKDQTEQQTKLLRNTKTTAQMQEEVKTNTTQPSTQNSSGATQSKAWRTDKPEVKEEPKKTTGFQRGTDVNKFEKGAGTTGAAPPRFISNKTNAPTTTSSNNTTTSSSTVTTTSSNPTPKPQEKSDGWTTVTNKPATGGWRNDNKNAGGKK